MRDATYIDVYIIYSVAWHSWLRGLHPVHGNALEAPLRGAAAGQAPKQTDSALALGAPSPGWHG